MMARFIARIRREEGAVRWVDGVGKIYENRGEHFSEILKNLMARRTGWGYGISPDDSVNCGLEFTGLSQHG